MDIFKNKVKKKEIRNKFFPQILQLFISNFNLHK